MAIELPIVSFICAFLVLLPLPWHWRAGTVATISITVWLFAANIINGVNATIWSDNAIIQATIWCDIATKITIGGTFALPAALFCLCMHLERVSSIRQVNTCVQDKRRRQIIDSLLCFGVPAIFMALHYVVQGHRFDIIQEFGCRPTIYVSIVALFLMWIPPLLFCVGAFIFAALAFRNFWHRRIIFARHLQNSNSALTPSRYLRLIAMSLSQMIFAITGSSLHIAFSLKNGFRPWISWADVHSDWGRIGQFAKVLIPKEQWRYTYALWWTVPVTSVVFFVFFGFGSDAVQEYKAFAARVKGIMCAPFRKFGPTNEKESKLLSLYVSSLSARMGSSNLCDASRPITNKNMISSSFSFLKKGFVNQGHKLDKLNCEKSASTSTSSGFNSSGTYPTTPTRAFAFPVTLRPLPAVAGSDDTVINITKDGNTLSRGEKANTKDMDALSLSEFAFSSTPSSSLPSYTQSPLSLSLSSRASFASASSSRPSPASTSSTSPSTRFSTHSSSYEVDLEAYPLPPTPSTPFTPSTIHSVAAFTATYTHRDSTSSTQPNVYPFVAI
nr:pheromone receptor B3 [Pleurotus eryngii]